MSAFGKRSGMGGGGRPSFGVAKPMKGGPGSGAATGTPGGGDQFPPLEELAQPERIPVTGGFAEVSEKGLTVLAESAG